MPEISRGDIVAADYVREYTIHVRFDDGTEGDLDLSDELYGSVFEPLKDHALFRQFRIHPELHTLIWPNGADFAPEFIYDQVRVPA